MVIDTSALLAVLQEEGEAEPLRHAMAADLVRLISAMSVLEATCVLASRRGPSAVAEMRLFLQEFGMEIVPFDLEQLAAAQSAWLRFGRGFHPARLNFGDCASYGLAKVRGERLLFLGHDFSQTDIAAVLEGGPAISLD